MKEILVCMHSSGSSQRSFLAGVADYARKHEDWSIRFDPRPAKLTPDVFRSAVESGIVGAIVCEDAIPRLNQTIATTPVPLVVFGATRDDIDLKGRPVGFAMSDDVGIGELAADHFLSLGAFRSFGYVPDPDGAGWSAGHLQGFRQRLAAARRKVSVFKSRGSLADRRARLAKWLDALRKPAAVMAACDSLGAEVVGLCHLTGIDVPKAVSVIGVGNDTLVDELANPALSTIAANHEEEGRLAAELLTRLIRDGKTGAAKTVQCYEKQIVQRGSTQFVTNGSYLVTRALDYMQANAGRNIKIGDITRHLDVSRRLLDLRFQEFHDETLNNAIVHARLAEVRRRLLSSSLPISRIAENCGFPNPSYLKKLFLARYGEPMESFRR